MPLSRWPAAAGWAALCLLASLVNGAAAQPLLLRTAQQSGSIAKYAAPGERAQQWRYLPVPLYRIRHRVVQRADDSTELRNLADLAAAGQKKPVLVTQGTLLQQALEHAKVPSAAAPSERDALQMLLLGRTDAVYGQDVNLLRNLRESGLSERLRLSPTIFFEDVQYATVSRQLSPEAEQRLTAALQALERDGSLKALAEKYK